MQNDAFKKFSKDLQEALVLPVNFLNKKAKRFSMTGYKKKKSTTADSAYGADDFLKIEKSAVDNCSLNNYTLSERPKSGDGVDYDESTVGINDSDAFGCAIHIGESSPISPRMHRSKVTPAFMHVPNTLSSLEQYSPERVAWVKDCLQKTSGPTLPNNVLRSELAWELTDDSQYRLSTPQGSRRHSVASNHLFLHPDRQYPTKTGYNNTSEPTGLLLVKLMQVTNKCTTKTFDVEWTLRVGDDERTSHSTRSLKDTPGNTATMNEVFLFEVNESFQLDMAVSGHPVATKFGTMAGFSNTQTVNFGDLQLAFCLEPMEKSVRTYKLRRPASEDPRNKSDCEIIVMVGLHVLEEPIEDRSWETQTLYQGNLTFMTRGARMAAWKRYWAVLEGRTIKLYDAEYQQKRDMLAMIPLAHILSVQPPDYEKVDVGANALSLVVEPQGLDMRSWTQVDVSELDYSLYAFTDSPQLHEVWSAHLEEALEQYQDNMARRQEVHHAKMTRRASQSLSRHSFESSVPPTPLEGDAEAQNDLIDLKFVW